MLNWLTRTRAGHSEVR